MQPRRLKISWQNLSSKSTCKAPSCFFLFFLFNFSPIFVKNFCALSKTLGRLFHMFFSLSTPCNNSQHIHASLSVQFIFAFVILYYVQCALLLVTLMLIAAFARPWSCAGTSTPWSARRRSWRGARSGRSGPETDLEWQHNVNKYPLCAQKIPKTARLT